MTMNEVEEIPGDEDISFYEESIIFENKPLRFQRTLCEPLSAKRVSKRLFDFYSEMTVDLPVWKESNDMSWENSSTESEQAHTFNSVQGKRLFLGDLPGYVFGPSSFVMFKIDTVLFLHLEISIPV